MITDNDIYIWIRGWEDTFTAAGRTREECRLWLMDRIEKYCLQSSKKYATQRR